MGCHFLLQGIFPTQGSCLQLHISCWIEVTTNTEPIRDEFPQCFLNALVLTTPSWVLLDLGAVKEVYFEDALGAVPAPSGGRSCARQQAQAEAGEGSWEGRSAEEALLIKRRLPFCRAVMRCTISLVPHQRQHPGRRCLLHRRRSSGHKEDVL